MAPKLARMAADDDRPTAAPGPDTPATPKERGDLGPLILALTRAVSRQAPERTQAPEAGRRG